MNTQQPQPTREEILETCLSAFLHCAWISNGLFEHISKEDVDLLNGLKTAYKLMLNQREPDASSLKNQMAIQQNNEYEETVSQIDELNSLQNSYRKMHPDKEISEAVFKVEQEAKSRHDLLKESLKKELMTRLSLHMNEFLGVAEMLIHANKNSSPLSPNLTALIKEVGRERLLEIVGLQNVVRFLRSEGEVQALRRERATRFKSLERSYASLDGKKLEPVESRKVSKADLKIVKPGQDPVIS